jgi:hypothetical protein
MQAHVPCAITALATNTASTAVPTHTTDTTNTARTAWAVVQVQSRSVRCSSERSNTSGVPAVVPCADSTQSAVATRTRPIATRNTLPESNYEWSE